MTHFIAELKNEADAAIAAMKDAALKARHVHARAELMRHMLTTAKKVKDRPKAEAVEIVVGEWMAAWHLDRKEWPHIAREMTVFTEAFHDYANHASDAADARLRSACHALDDALAREGTSISDQMAWRSQCAHRWWDVVSPTPADLPGRKDRPMIPLYRPDAPFWEAGCAEACK
ncbi:hypothetical protein [Terrarubrum flagellatum]|uniref:hypothetical protein n=1 Tax=Terrirubrum flagellatum TaxID=2895980 RepID=UPI00314543C8